MPDKFNKAFTFFIHLIDITSYISLFKQFEIFKKSILNDTNSNNFGNNINSIYINKYHKLLRNDI